MTPNDSTKKVACELIIVKCLELMNNKAYHINILNNIFDWEAKDKLTPYRTILYNSYTTIIEEYPLAAVGKLYKDLEHSASDLRNGKGKHYTQPMLHQSTGDGVWELIHYV
jgi:hypothetical protein|tara:strand:+ start:1359 stop:1691 length:333 start_codon:yes stop_codon:yes gene_type:complete